MRYTSRSPSADLQHFSEVATINDEKGFLVVLEQLLAERETHHTAHYLPAHILARARAMEAPVSYEPTKAEVHRGRMLLLAELRRKSNLPVSRYATLAGTSRQQLYRDIAVRRLLALSFGRRVMRVPDWKLVPAALALTQTVL